ncbi:hydantoinase B/oxoprolinase family protein [Myxococcota bacterium]|nr:hydantoinase B/oxoprolinase family protein [Myxococcota bacterium]
MSVQADPIAVAVLRNAYRAITDEMSHAIERSTRSPILCEARDFVTGLYDEAGRMLEQKENLPILSFSLGPVCKHILAYYGDDLHEGDVILHNDVFSMGNQNNDVAVFRPVFHEGRLVAFAAAKGHQADIGGAVAGGYNPDATEVWQEALRIPPVKVCERGRLRRDVWDLVFANIRFDTVAEDIKAQMGACVLAERRIQELLARSGREAYEVNKRALFDATRRMMEEEIRRVPGGVYRGEARVYYDGRNPGSVHTIRVTITVDGSRIRFDYTGTDPQTDGFVNGTYTSSASATILTFLQMVDPEIPHNEGMIEPIEIVIPEGTLLNAAYPAATTFGNHLCPPNADAIIRALADAIPDRVTAGWNQLLCSLTTGIDPRKGEKYVDIGFMGLKGGSGAMRGTDGYDHIGMIDASGGVLDQDYEMFEQQTPHRLLRHEYLVDSAGPGRWRGGIGVETAFVIGGDKTRLVTFGDGDVEPAFGLFGGGPGTLNRIALRPPGGAEAALPSKVIVGDVPAGTVYLQEAGGGGGYGDPRLRPAEVVAREVRDGLVSREAARRDYGVALIEGGFRVDDETTRALRAGTDPGEER